ncbi:MAG: carbamoyl-phosphate synthase large subunit [Solirubrobacteraceae bacterium]|nr:carbamoyl-phosphate synthase large subunit [Solirubrobacteraceae bacterium]
MSRREPVIVLVLGVGGTVSQAILKALALSPLSTRIVAACVTPYAAGLFGADRAYVSPRADDPGFLQWLDDIVRRDHVHAILSGVEEVLDVLAPEAEAIRDRTGSIAVVAEPSTLAVGRDKLTTCHWLRDRGLPHPRFADSGDTAAVEMLVEACGFPLLAKPRIGKASEGVALLQQPSDLERVRGLGGVVVQEYLGTPEEEFTAGCVCDADGSLRATIVMRRQLRFGTTVQAEVGEYPDVRTVAERVVSELSPAGPCNVQLRLRDGEPVPFELNVRFSGTASARARLGFNEVDAVLRNLVLGEPVPDLSAVTKRVMLRYWNEVYVPRSAIDELERTGELAQPDVREIVVEDWGSSR